MSFIFSQIFQSHLLQTKTKKHLKRAAWTFRKRNNSQLWSKNGLCFSKSEVLTYKNIEHPGTRLLFTHQNLWNYHGSFSMKWKIRIMSQDLTLSNMFFEELLFQKATSVMSSVHCWCKSGKSTSIIHKVSALKRWEQCFPKFKTQSCMLHSFWS